MAPRSFKDFVEQEMGTLPQFIIYAILEWTLIALLFLHGIIAFISEEFAKFFELKVPCLLCSRIDHLITSRNSSFYYNDSICESHKKDISSLAYCHIHQNLSDIKTMCEGCLLSYATERQSDSDTYKSVMGIMQKDGEGFDPTVGGRDKEAVKDEKGLIQRCSCCGEILKKRQSSKNLSRIPSFVQAPLPSPRAPVMTWKNEEARGLQIPHIRCTELTPKPDLELSQAENEPLNPARGVKKSASVPSLLLESDDIVEEIKTPSFHKGNKFVGIPLTDAAATGSPRLARLTKKLQPEKPESIQETNETEKEYSILNHLKKQVRLDRRTLIAMYMELDQERSASAVAANNAMAMITRLQAEKASVQMEALQYQRMMEEQAEYDEEAMQELNDLLMKREEEITALEEELDMYRLKYGPINRIGSGSEFCEIDDDESYQKLNSQSISTISERSHCGSPGVREQKGDKMTDEPSLDFQSERSYLLGLLADLERKLVGSSDDKCENKDTTGVANKATLMREMSFMRERLRVVEADSGFLKHAAMTFQKGDEGRKLLAEIALHLRKLRQLHKIPSGEVDA